MTAISTAVLIHGCHLQADLNGLDWESIVWGIDSVGNPTLNGRGTMGILVAQTYEADLVIFSTGASDRDGVKEGEFTRNYAYELNHRSDDLAVLTGFIEPDILREYLEGHSVLDLESQNTTDECRRNFNRCAETKIKRIVLVSSPWHIQRCHTEALKVAQEMRENGETPPEIIAIASYGSTQDIVILEPPHRGDRPKTRWHKLARRFFKISEEVRPAFEEGLETLFTIHGV